MPPIADSITPTAGRFPAHADVVIIGGGIIGVATALFLAQAGVSVVLCEKGEIAGEQSRQNWGWCRTLARDFAELPLALESIRLWRTANEITGNETGYRQTGLMTLFADEASVEQWRGWLEVGRTMGAEGEILDSDGVARLLPQCKRRWAGALYGWNDGVAEPERAVPAFANAAMRVGATILTRCAVRGFECSGGRISAVVTEKGGIRCNTAIIAAGSWSPLLCRIAGIRLPQLKVLGSVMRTAPVEGGPVPGGWAPGLAFRKRLDGGYTISQSIPTYDIVPDSFRYFREFLPLVKSRLGTMKFRLGPNFIREMRLFGKVNQVPSPFELVRRLEPEPDLVSLEGGRRTLEEWFPVFRGVEIVERWSGLIDATPDALPYISWIDDQPGLFVATGFSGRGFGIGLGAGQMVAAMVRGADPGFDPRPFRVDRFSRKAATSLGLSEDRSA
jgi:glycine/D-amino acid oxidase-like deaminating enzyme